MQTLIDPFELASRTLPAPPPAPPVPVAVAPTAPPPLRTDGPSEIVPLEADAPLPRTANPDSSGRLRCWCSED
jgi:hypothetical protein